MLSFRLRQVLEENKTEGNDRARGARTNSFSLCDERGSHGGSDSELRLERQAGARANHGKIREGKALGRS